MLASVLGRQKASFGLTVWGDKLGAANNILQSILTGLGPSRATGFDCLVRETHRSRGVRKRGMVFTTQLTDKLHAAVIGWRSMTFAIHAWKADRNVMTIRIGPAVAVKHAIWKRWVGKFSSLTPRQSIYTPGF
jgi:hypothetical protein